MKWVLKGASNTNDKSRVAPARWVSDIKFSPTDNYMVVGSHDTYVYWYELPLK